MPIDKRVLITGAAGFLGRAASEAFRAHGWNVVPLVRRSGAIPDEVVADFCSAGDAARGLARLPRCDVIVHAASHVDFAATARDEAFWPTQIFATAMLCAVAERWDAHMIFVSGALVHGSRHVVNQTSPLEPLNAYARAKVEGEKIVSALSRRSAILRFGGIFGPHGPAHLGLNRAILQAIAEKTPPAIYGSGQAKRNYIYSRDAAEVLVQTAERSLTGIHLAAGREVLSISRMLEILCARLLPRQTPQRVAGNEAADSIIETSPALGMGRTFEEAMADIGNEAGVP